MGKWTSIKYKNFGFSLAVLLLMGATSISSAQWLKTYGSDLNDQFHSVSKNNSNGFVAAGISEGFGLNDTGIWLTHFSENGDLENSMTITSELEINGAYVGVDCAADGSIYVCGHKNNTFNEREAILIKVNESFTIEWSRTLTSNDSESPRNVICLPSGDIIVCSTSNGYGEGSSDAYITKFNPDGQELWSSSIGTQNGAYNDHFVDAVETNSGDLIVIGNTEGMNMSNVEVGWICVLNQNGDLQEEYTLSDSNFSTITGIELDENGNIYLACERYTSTSNNSYDLALVSLTPQFDIAWQKTLSFPSDQKGAGIDVGQGLVMRSSFSGNDQLIIGVFDYSGNQIESRIIDLTDYGIWGNTLMHNLAIVENEFLIGGTITSDLGDSNGFILQGNLLSGEICNSLDLSNWQDSNFSIGSISSAQNFEGQWNEVNLISENVLNEVNTFDLCVPDVCELDISIEDQINCETGSATFDAVILGGSDDQIISWTMGEEVLGFDGSIQLLNLEADAYTLTLSVSISENCSDSVDIYFEIMPETELAVISDIQLCEGETYLLNPEAVNYTSFNWSDGFTSFDRLITSAGDYTLTVNNDCGSVSQSFNVNVINQNYDLEPQIELCEGELFSFQFPDSGEYFLNGEAVSGEVAISEAGAHFIEEVSFDCSFSSEVEIVILNDETVQINEDWLADACLPSILENLPQFLNNYENSWSPTDSVVTVSLENICGVYEQSFDLGELPACETCPFELYVPVAFTPNGDRLNEEFFPVVTCAENIKEYNLTLFNRLGQVIFHTTDFSESWNGNHQQGEHFVQDGVYNWVLNISYTNESNQAQNISKKGHVTLIR